MSTADPPVHIGTRPWRLSRLRRFTLAAVLLLFALQFLGVGLLVGGLSGSSAFWLVRLLDPFAWLESVAGSRHLALTGLLAVLPVALLYLVFGRAFCGWVCPMDWLFAGIDRFARPPGRYPRPQLGLVLAGLLLGASLLAGLPLFSNYLSHLTNFFRTLSGLALFASGAPVSFSVIGFSLAVILALLLLEILWPRLWCRVLCPVGKTYGLFNRISLLRLGAVPRGCNGCGRCDQVCYMGVDISGRLRKNGTVRDGNCIFCGRCQEACEGEGRVVRLGFASLENPQRKGAKEMKGAKRPQGSQIS